MCINPSLRVFRAACALLLTSLGASGPSNSLAASLVSESPFIPGDFRPPGTSNPEPERAQPNRAARQFEFRGMYELGGKSFFLVSQRNNRDRGNWIRLGEEKDGLLVEEFNPSENKILVELDGQNLWLEMDETANLSGRASVQTQSSNQNRVQRDRRTVRPTRNSVSRSSSGNRSNSASVNRSSSRADDSSNRARRIRPSQTEETAPVPPPDNAVPTRARPTRVPPPVPDFTPGPPPSEEPSSPFD